MIGAVVAEYNPFHNGHLYLMKKMRQMGCDVIVAVMSGDFVQRGEPALLSKCARAGMAVSCGADLVVENPVPWAMSPAESFAFGGAYIANALGNIDMLCFGSECGDIIRLQELADLWDNADFQQSVKGNVSAGMNYAAAYDKAVAEFLPGCTKDSESLRPNDILAIEYIKALNRLKSAIRPVAVKRAGVLHDGAPRGCFASASAIRELIADGKHDEAAGYLPEQSREILFDCIRNGRFYEKGTLDRAILFRLRAMYPDELSGIAGVGEGLENRIIAAAKSAQDLAELFDAAKTKRYPHSRIRRICLSAMLGITKSDTLQPPPYIRILAMNGRGVQALRSADPAIPVIGSHSQAQSLGGFGKRVYDLQKNAARLYGVCCRKPLKNYSEEEYRIARLY
ncbi:MAG: nucleotidyltransferase family protein [Clostridia bacterium]|nr:nucleotidyltransferase family protein [Clostridia bacterium]